MIEHIVKNNESIKDVLDVYHISLDELKEYNRHITDFSNLICGQKILVPYLKDEIEQILDKTESFAEKYYDDVINSFDENNSVEENSKSSDEINIRTDKNEGIEKSKSLDEVKQKYSFSCKSNLKAYGGIIPPKKPYNGNIFKNK